MRNYISYGLLIAVVAILLVSCGGGTKTNPPVEFDRMTAQVLDNEGNPIDNLAIRVEGRDTGKSTDGGGTFTLFSSDFPLGVEAQNEISFGRNGVVIGTQTVIPTEQPDLTIKFNDGTAAGDLGSITGNIFNEKTGEPLNGVEVSLFSDFGGVMIGLSDAGRYSFENVPVGVWRLSTHILAFHPKTASLRVEAGQQTIQHLALTPEGSVGNGDGLRVRGYLLDSDSGSPVPNATVTMFADTGYVGIGYPESPMLVDPAPMPGDQTEPGFVDGGPGIDADESKEPSTSMPWIYDPQFQETMTDASGYFEFSDEVVAYNIWLECYADSYLNASHSEFVNGLTGVLDLNLEIEPYVQTNISGVVHDEFGDPVPGAYVEFVFSGGQGYYDDIALPGVMDWEEVAEDGMNMREQIGAPAPANGPEGQDENWDDFFADSENASPMLDGAPQAGGGAPQGPDTDNEWMMRFRFENSQQNREPSDIGYFNGYYSTNADENGEFNFEDVPAGAYYVFASAYRHLTFNAMLDIVEDETQNLFNISLPNVPVGSVEGHVVDEDGNPLGDVLVNAVQPFSDPFTYSDASGYYRIDNIPIGIWLVSGFKKGYLTDGTELDITDGAVLSLDLVLATYEPPVIDTINYTGSVVNGFDNSQVAGADMVFTPVERELGGYYQHVVSGTNGTFSAALIPSEYNVLIQKEGYEDIYIRVFVDQQWPQMDFWMWPIGVGGGGGGPWGGIGVMEDVAFMDAGMPDMPPPAN